MSGHEESRSTARRLLGVLLTLRGRLILLVCFATVPAILFIFWIAARERESAMERMETEARHLGSLASREHAHQLNGARELVRRIGAAMVCHAPKQEGDLACPDYLPALLGGSPQFANIGVATPEGDVICSAASIEHSASLRDNIAFERALATSEVETGGYVVGFVGRPVLHLAYAVRDTRGSPCAVAFVAVELGWLDRLVEQAKLPADYSLWIVDRMGQVLARSGAGDRDVAGERGRADPALARALERPRGAVLAVDSPATSRYFVATPMEGFPGIFVVAGLPYDRVQQTANRAFYRTLIGLILVTIFAIVSSILAAELSILRVLRALTRAVRRFGAGDLTARAPIPGTHGELRELAISFRNMADALAARQRETREAQERLRALSNHLQVARDEEAGRIARELHDELGQVLTGLKLELSRVRSVVRSAGAPDVAGEHALERMTEQIDAAIDTVRRISSELRPPVLDRLGLAAALDWLARDCEAKAELAILLDLRDLGEPIDRVISTVLFRIVQEALTNVIRHADATEVVVTLVGTEKTLTLTVEDDGTGIDPAAVEGPLSLGILGMRERVHLVGGSFAVEGAPGKGTRIRVEVPRERPTMPERLLVQERAG